MKQLLAWYSSLTLTVKQLLAWYSSQALTVFNVIKDMLIRCSLPIASCIGQAYDGAACMSGIRNGIQALMKKEVVNCLYVHCFAHSLNLAIQDVTKRCDLLHNCMEFTFQLIQLIRYSPKQLNLFERSVKRPKSLMWNQHYHHHP